MAIQVSYPGVYIDEVEPAAPITGVSTSIAAFIGIAQRGPQGVPTFVTSIDDFTTVFGGAVVASTPYYLPIAVDGFFRNGGTQAFVTRVGTGVAASAPLAAESNAALALATVSAIADGSAGEGGKVTVELTSALGTALVDAGEPDALIASRSAGITLIDPTNLVLTLDDTAGFAAGDGVVLRKNAGNATLARTIASVQDAASTVTLTTAVTGNGWTTANRELAADSVTVPLFPPGALTTSLQALIPTGSVVSITDDDAKVAWAVVAQAGPAGVTLTQPLGTAFVAAKNPVLRTAEFAVTVTDPDGVVRVYPKLSTSPSHPRWWGNAVDDPYARLVLERDANGAAVVVSGADPRPAALAATPLAGAVPDDPDAAWDLVRTGIDDHLKLLEPIDEVSLVVVPGLVDAPAQQSVLAHCENMADRFAIFDAPRTPTIPTVIAHREQLVGADAGFAALYYPWITVFDRARNQLVPQPPSGHVAGVFARTDGERGVHKAPANAVVNGAVGVELRISDNQQGALNPEGVNAIRVLPGRGQPVVWGARTTANNANWQYVNIRRLFLFLEESIQESLTGSVFEPNDLALWQKLKRTLNEFLTRVWTDGALFGATPKEAFFVRIDEALNPPATRKLGRLYVEIGVQPVYPAEFIIVRIGIWDGGASVAEV